MVACLVKVKRSLLVCRDWSLDSFALGVPDCPQAILSNYLK